MEEKERLASAEGWEFIGGVVDSLLRLIFVLALMFDLSLFLIVGNDGPVPGPGAMPNLEPLFQESQQGVSES